MFVSAILHDSQVAKGVLTVRHNEFAIYNRIITFNGVIEPVELVL
jgi:hypothetical protein